MQRRADAPADHSARHTDGDLRCPNPRCNHLLGRASGSLVIVKHHGRVVVAERVRGITCEDCGSTWYPPADDGR